MANLYVEDNGNFYYKQLLCLECQEIKDQSEFYKGMRKCKECQKKYKKVYFKKNTESKRFIQLSEEEKKSIATDISLGVSNVKICEKYNVTYSTFYTWRRTNKFAEYM
jgi:hypothetical protein